MNGLKFLVLLFLCFFGFVTCHVDPGLKKHPRPMKVIKSVVHTYNPSLDILFIIDDSISMEVEQDLLTKNAELFVNQFLNVRFVDYHIGVTTSSISSTKRKSSSVAPDGRLHRCDELAKKYSHKYSNYVSKKTYRAGECLSEMMKVGKGGNTAERFFSIPALVFSGSVFKKENRSFYRPHAHLAVFVMTDSYDQSNVSSEESYSFLLNLKKGDENKIHYAVGYVMSQRYGCHEDESGQDKYVLEFERMVGLFGRRGYSFDLCQASYGKDLAHFASHLVQSVLTIPLDSLPNIASIEVRYEYEKGVQKIFNGSGGWTYDIDENAIHLSRNIDLEQTGGQFYINYEPIYADSVDIQK